MSGYSILVGTQFIKLINNSISFVDDIDESSRLPMSEAEKYCNLYKGRILKLMR